MSVVRELVDPLNTLPEVALVPTRTQEWPRLSLIRNDMVIVAGSEAVGSCTLVFHTDVNKSIAHFDGIEINEKSRGQGIGLSAYVCAIELAHGNGLAFQTQRYDQTAESRKIWEILARVGAAEIIEPFQPSNIRAGKFVGRFIVPKP